MRKNTPVRIDPVHFQEVTQVRSANDYLNSLTQDSLIIYSPTSLRHASLNNDKVHTIDSRIFGRSVALIKALAHSKRSYTNIVSLGGGTATDVAKYIAYKSNATFTCIPSMLSTNAFSTNKLTLVVNDEKVTLGAKLADKIILDTSLLQTSPQQNLYGIADVLSIHTALYDWILSEKKGIETVDKSIFDKAKILLDDVNRFVANTDTNHISYEIPTLFSYIGESGHITNLHGTGRPESGSEHIFAKALEKQIDIPHGVSVSLGILLMSILQNNYSSDVASSINKIGTLKFIGEAGITKNLIIEVLTNMRPRKNRYTIIDETPLTKDKAAKVIQKLIDTTAIALK